jgi:hypothetical protein
MIDWTARARATLAQPSPAPTVKTDETRILSVSSVGSVANADCRKVLSSVSSVAPGAVSESNTGSGNPYMTRQQGDECHVGGWSGDEIATFQGRDARFRQLRRPDAEHLAERLTLRALSAGSWRSLATAPQYAEVRSAAPTPESHPCPTR